MADINVAPMRSDEISDWAAANPLVKPGEIVIANEDGTGVPDHLRIGTKIPASPATPTRFNDLPEFPLYTAAERDKLAGLTNLSGPDLLAAFNDAANTDILAILNNAGLTGPQIITLIDAYSLANWGEADIWRQRFASSFNGRAMDEFGNLDPAAGDYAVADITGLVTALSGKSDAGHGHVQADISGLAASLNAKVDTSRIGVDVAQLEDVGGNKYLKASQIPPSLGNAVTSVHGRMGAVVGSAGDYTATQITNTPAGNIAATTVQAAINELDTEKVATSLLGAASGIPLMDSGSKILTTYLPTVATTAVWYTGYCWATGTVTFTNLPGTGAYWEWNNSARRIRLDTSTCTDVFIQGVIGTTSDTGGKLEVRYSTDGTNFTSISAADFPIDAGAGTGYKVGTVAALPAGAIGTNITFLIRAGNAGAGASSPVLSGVNLVFKHSVNLGPGVQNATQIKALLDADMGTGWRDPAGALADNSVALSKIVNFATQTAPLRKSSGTGSLEVGTQADWRTFLDVTNTFNGRKGAVVPGNADYTTALVADTTDKRYVTDADLIRFRRAGKVTRITTAAVVGLDEEIVICDGAPSCQITNAARCERVALINVSTTPVTITAEAGTSLKNAQNATMTSYVLNRATAVDQPTSVCFVRNPLDNSRLLAG